MMIKLNREKIIEAAQKVNNPQKDDISDVIELLGADKLKEIFDEEQTIRSMVENLKTSGKIHPYDMENRDGFEVLEGLLNEKVIGDLGSFFDIKPKYILKLPLKQQEILADTFSEGKEYLREVLISLWQNGIPTTACGNRNVSNINDSDYYIFLELPIDDISSFAVIEQAIKEDGIYSSLNITEENIGIRIGSKDESMYETLLNKIKNCASRDIGKDELEFYREFIREKVEVYKQKIRKEEERRQELKAILDKYINKSSEER